MNVFNNLETTVMFAMLVITLIGFVAGDGDVPAPTDGRIGGTD